ncbi:MAG TPA: YncE family protein [Gemmatimonadales bacterium]|nr:YncE family protein [Gemmatimonadales bacterium]
MRLAGPARAICFTSAAVALACGGSEKKPITAHPTSPPVAASAPTAVDIYAATGPNDLSPLVAHALFRVYVPNSASASVSVIDPTTYKVLRTFKVGAVPQHVVPAYDLGRLWVANDSGNSLTPIDPATGREGPSVPVDDPYNLYFTPDGRFAIVVAEREHRLDFRDPQSMALHDSVRVRCGGVDHMEFTADGRSAIATCEFSGQLLKLDVASHHVEGYLQLPADSIGHAMPQDVRSSPDGKVFYVADMTADGVHLVDPDAFRVIGFIRTGRGTHGLYPSRDHRVLYVSNRGWNTIAGGQHGPGSISVIDFATRRVIANWPIPGGGSPDMGNVTADGKELWLSGRYDGEVYVFDTATGTLTHRIRVQRGPHGLTVWPQPGRYSLGHTGNMR